MSLRVVEPGLFSLLVDNGRPASRGYGVPVGGAADRAAFALGNALVGNPADAVALEITLVGPVLRAQRSVTAVVFGAPFEVGTSAGPLHSQKTFTLVEGEELRIGGTPSLARGYLCVAGGFQAPRVLGSSSALAPVRRGDVLVTEPAKMRSRFVREIGLDEDLPEGSLRFVAGTHAGWFNRSSFAAAVYRVSPTSNRMGVRLQGPPLEPPDRPLISEPVCPGTVQVTPDGQCIILGVDGQTIGGYPRIAQVISADLDRVAQLRPGEPVRFMEVDLATAEEAACQRRGRLAEWMVRLQTAERFATERAH